ncbi:hypothetical protein [Actinomadura hibisca]|uniref:hypothetical protein n=1 Tax=Actinomadura hibisca TaxID=68565 RepID=UPI00083617B7|nr:hypothetical protein [Actinomadura hibisca]
MPRCTRCNTPLSGVSEEATTPDPGQGRPLPPPWSNPPADPADWSPRSEPPDPHAETRSDRRSDPPGWTPSPPPPAAPADWSPSPADPADWAPRSEQPPPYPPPPPPAGPGETSIALSPEPWDEPVIWQPPEPARRSRKPYLLIAAGAVLLAAVAAAIVLWPSGDDKGANQAGDTGRQTTQAAPETSEETSETPSDDPSESAEPTASGDQTQQARSVDALLGEMAATRSELATATEGGCDQTILRRVGTQRADQLAQARGLETGALENGTEMKSALVRALEASVESNRLYQTDGCPTEPRSADQRATSAKSEFLEYWNPVARDTGMSTRDQGGI